jgi:hypothetical protein
LKKFKEEPEQDEKPVRNKFLKLRQAQNEKDNKMINPGQAEDDSLHSIITNLREEFLSDLNAAEIPNSDISDISESEF